MFKIYGILKRHFEQLHDEVIEAIFTYEHSEEKFEFAETPTHIMSQDIEVGIGEKKIQFYTFCFDAFRGGSKNGTG